MADGAETGWGIRGSPSLQRRRAIERVYRAPHGSKTRLRVFRGLCTRVQPDVWLRVETCRFSVDGDLGREPQPPTVPVERPDFHARNGVRCIADARDTRGD